ncbi:NADP-dependent oxidoreductase [Sphingobacterium hotanense]|uniref:NADP-dependent oxidoreductase n=1 Tax=Sphingobacterium hotanense TaxID=649196 RepID=A0ABT7NS44_9SPHI|nr:NADP-dependent oxidoreductase [Sphingobacterium hotanense]MDM1049986.1 NADP-dependent oxidoreductase [Sphingobacterium hotanense]
MENNTHTSKVLIAKSYGPSDVLEFQEITLDTLPQGFARIRVKAAGINPIDARRMTGEFKHAGLPQTFGTEFTGEIIEIADDHSDFKVGDFVLGSGNGFTHATVIDVPVGNLIRRPENIAWEVAGSIAGVAQTATTVLDEIGPINSLLVHGASGGVGSIIVQLARERGITVVGTSSKRNLEYVNSLGAIAVEYGDGLTERIKEVFPNAFDASIDMVGNEQATQVSLEVVKEDGVIGTIAGKPTSSERVVPFWVKRNPQNLQHVVNGIEAGKFTWEIDSTFPFENAAEAYSKILEGHTRGKIVLTF